MKRNETECETETMGGAGKYLGGFSKKKKKKSWGREEAGEPNEEERGKTPRTTANGRDGSPKKKKEGNRFGLDAGKPKGYTAAQLVLRNENSRAGSLTAGDEKEECRGKNSIETRARREIPEISGVQRLPGGGRRQS